MAPENVGESKYSRYLQYQNIQFCRLRIYCVIINDSKQRDQICPGTQATRIAYSFCDWQWKVLNVTRSVGSDTTGRTNQRKQSLNSVTIHFIIKFINYAIIQTAIVRVTLIY